MPFGCADLPGSLQELLKAKQKLVAEAENAAVTAQEEKERAEAKLASAKVEHEKALTRAKNTGVLPAISTMSAESIEKRQAAAPSLRVLLCIRTWST